jgi:hypothetical protein
MAKIECRVALCDMHRTQGIGEFLFGEAQAAGPVVITRQSNNSRHWAGLDTVVAQEIEPQVWAAGEIGNFVDSRADGPIGKVKRESSSGFS